MTQATETRPPLAAGAYEPCGECGAPLDPQQRYCVECAARRGNGANPSSRYFAAMSKKARRPLSQPRKAAPASRAAAVGFFALLPIAVAIGVVVGRGDSGNSDNQALLQALRKQEAAVASAPSASPTTATAKGKAKGKSANTKQANSKTGGKVLAKTKNGTVHQLTGYKPSKQQEQADTKLVEENPEQTGKNYIKAQQNLPDVVVVGGSPGSSSAPAGKGVEP